MPRAIVYVDGFNLYYGIRHLRDGARTFKWLNPKALAEEVLPRGVAVERVKYYTARVSSAIDPGAPGRQQVYLNALATVPETEIHLGRFLSKFAWRPVLGLPIADRDVHSPAGGIPSNLPLGTHTVSPNSARAQSSTESLEVVHYPVRGGQKPANSHPASDAIKARVNLMEEKGSDVNLASHLVHDAWSGLFDVAAVISLDTDLIEPIRIVTQELRKKVYIVAPTSYKRPASKELQAVATGLRRIKSRHLRRAQFPDTISSATPIARPAVW